MKKYDLLIGSHVSLSAPDYFLGSVKEAISYNANALMVYTGAPQNTIRKPMDLYQINEGKQLLAEHNIDIKNVIVHAPYIINLCSDNLYTRKLAIDFLIQELQRCDFLGIKYLVLHPGSGLSQDIDVALNQVYSGLNYIFDQYKTNITICIETMAGKGSEVGKNLKQIKTIIDNVNYPKNIGVCIDTCHLNDAGYNMNFFDDFMNEFEKIIGLDKLKVVHINDSKNPLNSHKDRHENIGYGYIGFDALINIIYHPKLNGIVKILETPYVSFEYNEKKYSLPPYKYEIEMIKNRSWIDFKKLIKTNLK